jgi:hypothetical protein
VVVAVVGAGGQEELRRALTEVEQAAGTGHRKWHKARPTRRLHYLNLVLEKGLGVVDVFFGSYPKPLSYSLPFVDIIEHAINARGPSSDNARVFVDGMDRQKARELTNALRIRGVALEMVKGRRDESEPLIRLADMWAGCIRASLLGRTEEQELVARALKLQRIRELTG